MIKYKDLLTKPADKSWNKELTTAILDHISANYSLTGKLICHVSVFTDTTQASTLIFDTMDHYNEYFSDPALAAWHAAKNAHNEANGIVRSNVEITDIDDTDADYVANFYEYALKTVANQPVNVENFLKV